MRKLNEASFFDKNTLQRTVLANDNSLYSDIKRWIKNGEIIQLKKGLYVTSCYYQNCLEKEARPNLERINDLLGKKYSLEEILGLVDKKVVLATSKYKTFFRNDLSPFIDNPDLINPYIEGYAKNYEIRKGYLLKNLA